jgi:hypothetical protein
VITALRGWRVGDSTSGEAVARRRWWLDLGIVAPIAAALAYLAVVAIRLPGTLSSFYWYGDFPEALRLGDAVFHGGFGQGLAVPSQSGLAPLWVIGLLHQVTGSDGVGMALGVLMLLATAGFMVAAAHRVLGIPSAVAVGALCIAAPPVVAWELLTPIAHASTLLITAVAAWQLVRLSQARPGRGIASSVAVGALAGVCIASDPLVLLAAVVPWLVYALMIARRHHERRLPLLITAFAAVVSAGLVVVLASANGIVERGNTAFSPSIDGIAAGLRTTAATLGQMIVGAWYSDVLPAAVAMLGIVVFAAVVYMATRGLTRRTGQTPAGREIYVWFWVLSSAGLIAGLCISGLGVQRSPINYQGHYVDGLWFATAALLPFGLIRAGALRRVTVLGVTCLALVGAIGVARMPAYPFEGPDYVDAAQLTKALDSLGVTHGYGGYWESYAVGWHTDQRITALPLQQCTASSGVRGLCAYEFAAPASYGAAPGAVFVIVLRGSCTHDDLCIDAGNLATLPTPETIRSVGFLQIYVYAHDVFAHLRVATGP